MTRLEQVVRDLEQRAAREGWDAEPRLYALVAATELHRNDPDLARQAGVPDAPGRYAVLPQEALPGGRTIEAALHGIVWPERVDGCALVIERLLLPDAAGDPPARDAQAWASEHPDREEARIVVAVLREGSRHAAMRLRSHDRADQVLSAPDLVPGLADALATTLG